jgi:hypothetical protein
MSQTLARLNFAPSLIKRNISSDFETLLERHINIKQGVRSLASQSQNHLREFLNSECDRDSNFPRVLSRNDSDFLGGSFSRHTKIKPLDDIDIYLPLDGSHLFYYVGGSVMPYTVVADDVLHPNPLLTPRWMRGQYISSSALINGFASVLRRRFPQTTVNESGEAVRVQMTLGSSTDGEGIGYDVVPCFRLDPLNQNDTSFYLIPDGQDGWIRTNPRLDDILADTLQKHSNRVFRRAVKVLKFWNVSILYGALNSYYIELAVARCFWDFAKQSKPFGPLSHGVALAFWALQQHVQLGTQTSWVTGAPLVAPGELNSSHVNIIKSSASLACSAWDLEKQGNLTESASIWCTVFGEDFPG